MVGHHSHTKSNMSKFASSVDNAPSTTTPPPDLSDYEVRRLQTIRRNNATLRQLGLISILEEAQSNATAAGIVFRTTTNEQNDGSNSSSSDYDDDADADSDESKYATDKTRNTNTKRKRKRKRKRKQQQQQQQPREASRKSRRLQGLTSSGGESLPKESRSHSRQDLLQERRARVQECREVRLKAAKALAEMGDGAKKAAKENPTATYEHCLMRVRSMSDKGLRNRIKAIERAAGKHCVVKMAIFKSCLQDENQWELAVLANAALERLKELKPIPED